MSSSATPTIIQNGLAQGEQPVDNVDSMPRINTLDPNTPGTLPSTPIRAASSVNSPVTPKSSVYKYSTNPCTNRALVSSPISATPKRPYGPLNPTPAASPNSAVSTPFISPVPAAWVPLVMPYHWERPGWTPAPAFGPPTPPGMTPSEQEDFEHDRARRIWQAVIRDEQEYHRWQHHVMIRRMRRVVGLAQIRRNERKIRDLLAERKRSLNGPSSAPASTPAPAPEASPSTPASTNRRRTTKKSTLAREMNSLSQLGRAGNTISHGKRKRTTDDEDEEDTEAGNQTPGTVARTLPMGENTMSGVWAGRLRPRAVRKEEKKRGDGRRNEGKSGGRPKRKNRK